MVSSPLKHVLRTRSDDSWTLIEFTPYEKQKYQVTFVTKNKNFSFHLHTQTSRLISFVTKILSLTHRKCRSKPSIWILPPLLQKNKYGRSKLCRDQIFSHTIYLYNKKFDWLFIVDPIWLVWHTYISHSLTQSPIDPFITYPTRRLRSIFLQKKITQKVWRSTHCYQHPYVLRVV